MYARAQNIKGLTTARLRNKMQHVQDFMHEILDKRRCIYALLREHVICHKVQCTREYQPFEIILPCTLQNKTK
jgi:hypothetical protein